MTVDMCGILEYLNETQFIYIIQRFIRYLMTYKVSSVYKLYINILHTISSATLLYAHNMRVDYVIWHVEQLRTDLIKRVAYAGEKRKGREGRR